jgi:hypothetical protein
MYNTTIKSITFNNNVVDQKNNINLNIDLDKELILTFKMKKTETPDVYKLYLIDRIKSKDGSYKIKNIKIDTALIPTIACSTFCTSVFTGNAGSALVKCKYIHDKQKWIPFEKDLIKTIPDKMKKLFNNKL